MCIDAWSDIASIVIDGQKHKFSNLSLAPCEECFDVLADAMYAWFQLKEQTGTSVQGQHREHAMLTSTGQLATHTEQELTATHGQLLATLALIPHFQLFECSIRSIQGCHMRSPSLVNAEAIPVHPPGLHINGQVGGICHPISHNPAFVACNNFKQSGHLQTCKGCHDSNSFAI